MSYSRQSLSRYGPQPPAFYETPEELFMSKFNTEVFDPAVTLSKYLGDFYHLYQQTQLPEYGLYDTTLQVEPNNHEIIYAQKQLLVARSVFFENILDSDNTNTNEEFSVSRNMDEVLEVKFKPVFTGDFPLTSDLLKEVVEYIYYAFWEPKDIERTRRIFILACKLDLKDLRNITGDELSNNLNVNNAVQRLIDAHTYQANQYKKRCFKFIIEKKKQIDRTNLEALARKVKDGHELIEEIFKEDVYTHHLSNLNKD